MHACMHARRAPTGPVAAVPVLLFWLWLLWLLLDFSVLLGDFDDDDEDEDWGWACEERALAADGEPPLVSMGEPGAVSPSPPSPEILVTAVSGSGVAVRGVEPPVDEGPLRSVICLPACLGSGRRGKGGEGEEEGVSTPRKSESKCTSVCV